ncbi:AAA domain-containing protein [Catellatospora coxensis]
MLDADSSQSYAVNAAVAGHHLVVKGPPGTGKSQTIANMIMALAARGAPRCSSRRNAPPSTPCSTGSTRSGSTTWCRTCTATRAAAASWPARWTRGCSGPATRPGRPPRTPTAAWSTRAGRWPATTRRCTPGTTRGACPCSSCSRACWASAPRT